MSDCMTLDVFAAEEKYPNGEVESTKDIVRSILNEALHSVVGNSEKVKALRINRPRKEISDSNHIGDYNAAEGFLPQFGYIPVNPSDTVPRKINEPSEEETIKLEEKPREYKVIQEKAPADNELRIQNEKVPDIVREAAEEDTCSLSKDRGSTGEEFDEKKKVSSDSVLPKFGEHSRDLEQTTEEKAEAQQSEKPFTPLTTEDFRQTILQVWKNVNSPVFNGLDSELSDQPQEVVRLMEELSKLKMMPETTVDPNRPRACTLVEEDVKKMIKEIGEMNFNAAAPSFENVKTPHNANSQDEENSGEKTCNESGQKEESGSEEAGEILTATEEQPERCVHFPDTASVLYAPPVPAFKSQKFNDSYDFQVNTGTSTMSTTEFDEALVESSESVVQIIEPREDSNDENEEGCKITFSLLENPDLGNYHKDNDSTPEDSRQLYGGTKGSLEDFPEIPKVQSGMTTVGPMKYLNYDPKVLTGPDVDYGKMTKISGSREMRKDSNTDTVRSSESKKFCTEDGDESPVISFGSGFVEFDTIVNHDIASMTKVQKVKEVLSDQPKSDEDFKDEEKLLRFPLDLKDVDADSCDSYNVIDIGIPLLTIEETNDDNSKELCENIQIILDGNGPQIVPDDDLHGNNSHDRVTSAEEETAPENSLPDSENVQEDKDTASNRGACQKLSGKQIKGEERHQISSNISGNRSVTQVNVGQGQKHNTISRVFQKASNRFLMKDSDSFLRNSKSLPRDTSKIPNTESFKSLLDDCQTSAATVLKKSRSLLSSTQNVLKAVSKTGFGHTLSGEKQVYAASDVAAEQTESRQSTSLKNNSFIKFKDTIRNKVGKTLKSLENMTSEAKGNAKDGNKVKNSCRNQLENKMDQTESIKKPPPKSPLVCTNQFIQSQACEEKMKREGSSTALSILDPEAETPQNPDESPPLEAEGESSEQEIEVICGVKFQGNSRFTSDGPNSDSVSEHMNDANSDQIDYVIMETVQGLSEDEITDSAQVDRTVIANRKLSRINTESAQRTASNNDFLNNSSDVCKSLTMPLDSNLQDDAFEEFIDKDGKAVHESFSNEKLRRKSKKLSARIRSFWQTAFGKAKATSQKNDVS